MPELPDVEIFRSYFDSTALHQNIREITTFESQVYKANPEKIKRTLAVAKS